ncbi:AAA family ATPase [Aeromicrobium yanjiei]|uniref:AAA family ATPase n=2 Tax=Nocardioidaceae TaxID=85015 RepID=A0A5Q2MLJ0_9ACTN|nr:AAA family ATPase [Aeromicrobium yanjiei]
MRVRGTSSCRKPSSFVPAETSAASAIMDTMATDRTPSTPLFGRAAELEQLLVASGVLAGDPAAVLLGGDAGIGKTRLLRELAERARAAGHRVVAGHCLDLGDSAMPYQPFAEAFASIDDAERDELAARFPALAPLLPWPSAEQSAGVDRSELFASVVAGLDLLAAEQPLLLVIEDAHWADASTRHLIRYALSYLFTHPVHVVVSYRADDLHRRHPLRQAIAEWARLPAVRRVELSPLDDVAVADLVRARGASDLAGDGLSAVVRRAAGNAFFAEELLDAGLADSRAMLPETLADLLLIRLDRLDDEARQVVRAASCSGGRVSDRVLSQVVGLPGPVFDEAIRSAIDHKIMTQVDGDAYAFRHALLAEAVRDDLLPGERRRINHAYLDVLTADGSHGSAAEISMHAAAAGELTRAFVASVEAGESAVRLSGYDEAARHYEQALDLLGSAPEGTDVIGLLVAAADSWMTSGHLLRALALLNEHLEALPAATSAEDRARLMIPIGTMALIAERDAESARVSQEVLEVVGPERTVLRARAEALRTAVLADAWRDDEALELGEHAVAMAEDLGANDIVAEVTVTLARVLSRTGGSDLDKSRQRYDELIESSRKDGNVLGELRGLHNLAFVLLNAGDLDAAEAAFRAAMARAQATGRTWAPYGFDGKAFAGVICYIRGRWDEALALQDVGTGAPLLADAILTGEALMVAAGRGEVDALVEEPRLRGVWERDIALAVHSGAALIDLHGDSGNLDAARAVRRDVAEIIERVWDGHLFMAHVRLGALVVGQMATAAADLARSEHADLLEEAAGLEALAAEVAQANPTMGPEGHAWRLRLTAEAARLRWVTGIDAPSADELERAWRDAVAAFAAFGQPFEEARSATRLAALLLATGRDEEARSCLAAARETARSLGAKPLLAEIAALGGKARSEVELTPRELEVLQQVSAGRSNGEIGSRLFISTKTVSVHVSNILAKLGAAGRTEAAAIARRKGLLD